MVLGKIPPNKNYPLIACAQIHIPRNNQARFHDNPMESLGEVINGLHNGKMHKVQLWGCHDLHMTDWEFLLKRTAIDNVVCLIQRGVSLNQGHFIKGNHPLLKLAFIEILNTT